MNRDDRTIICRCSDVTLGEVRRLIADGYTTFDEIKRVTRMGMGPCQGKTCSQLVLREIAAATGKPLAELNSQKTRPPATGVTLDSIYEEAKRNGDNG